MSHVEDRFSSIDRRLDLAADVAVERARRDVMAMRRADEADLAERRERARHAVDRCAEHQRVTQQESIMGITTVRSPWNREGLTTPNHERRTGVSPGSSSSRSDGGHIGPHSGGKGWTPERVRGPVVETRDPNRVIDPVRR
jgi:hypothetical protein